MWNCTKQTLSARVRVARFSSFSSLPYQIHNENAWRWTIVNQRMHRSLSILKLRFIRPMWTQCKQYTTSPNAYAKCLSSSRLQAIRISVVQRPNGWPFTEPTPNSSLDNKDARTGIRRSAAVALSAFSNHYLSVHSREIGSQLRYGSSHTTFKMRRFDRMCLMSRNTALLITSECNALAPIIYARMKSAATVSFKTGVLSYRRS